MNIVDRILFRCKQNPPAAALSSPGRPLSLVSYARLERFIHNVSRRALKEGIRGGQIVAIQVQDQMLHTLLIFGLMRIGVASISASVLRFPPALRVDVVLSEVPLFLGVADVPRVVIADLGWTEGDGSSVDDKYVCHDGDRIARISMTNGSTGEPKATALTHRMLLRRTERYVMMAGDAFMGCSRFFTDLGLGNGFCTRILIYALSRGCLFCLPGKDAMDSLQSFELPGKTGVSTILTTFFSRRIPRIDTQRQQNRWRDRSIWRLQLAGSQLRLWHRGGCHWLGTATQSWGANPFLFGGGGAGRLFQQSQEISWLATFRARAGIAVESTLFYLTGGLAVGHVNNSMNGFCPTNGGCNGALAGAMFGSFSDDTTRVGWTAGVGFEHMFDAHWTVRGEFRYVDLGQSTSFLADTAPFGGLVNVFGNYRGVFSNTLMTGTVGIGYKF
jgi:opacity protein-like surface antigen